MISTPELLSLLRNNSNSSNNNNNSYAGSLRPPPGWLTFRLWATRREDDQLPIKLGRDEFLHHFNELTGAAELWSQLNLQPLALEVGERCSAAAKRAVYVTRVAARSLR